jgi:hypothetical protein
MGIVPETDEWSLPLHRSGVHSSPQGLPYSHISFRPIVAGERARVTPPRPLAGRGRGWGATRRCKRFTPRRRRWISMQASRWVGRTANTRLMRNDCPLTAALYPTPGSARGEASWPAPFVQLAALVKCEFGSRKGRGRASPFNLSRSLLAIRDSLFATRYSPYQFSTPKLRLNEAGVMIMP